MYMQYYDTLNDKNVGLPSVYPIASPTESKSHERPIAVHNFSVNKQRFILSPRAINSRINGTDNNLRQKLVYGSYWPNRWGIT